MRDGLAHRVWRPIRKLLRNVGLPLRRALRPQGYRQVLRRLATVERNLGTLLSGQYAGLQDRLDPRRCLALREFRVFSQNGEDGLILYILSQIGTAQRRFVEFGIQDGRECNAANLVLRFGWSGLFMEYSEADARRARDFYHREQGIDPGRVAIVQTRVTAENINTLLEQAGMRGEIDLLSIDIDSIDYWVWRAIDGVTARLVVIEYNASLGPEEVLTCPYDPDLDVTSLDPSGVGGGASLSALQGLAEARGYALVGCESNGVNALFVRKDLLGGDLVELTPAQAFYPHARRSRKRSAEEQLAMTRELPFVRPPAES